MIPAELALEGVLLREDEPLAPRTTLRIGGAARIFAEVRKTSALAPFLRAATGAGIPLLALGKGSNVLIPDDGWDGVVFVLAGEFQEWRREGDLVRAGGGVSLMSLAVGTAADGLSGLEGLSGIPSTIGGAVRINAGAYGTEIFDLLEAVELVTPGGGESVLGPADLRHSYRFTELMERRDVVAAATLRLRRRPSGDIEARLAEVRQKRREALPKEPNAGSIFRNPPGLFAGRLLEECGMKGRTCGGAAVSQRHANVIVNAGGATARDVLRLMEEMRAAVRAKFGVELVPEIEVPSARGADAMRRRPGP